MLRATQNQRHLALKLFQKTLLRQPLALQQPADILKNQRNYPTKLAMGLALVSEKCSL
jgi:hypothetical protein